MDRYEEFIANRQKLNKKILDKGNLDIKRFFALDGHAYESGALTKKTKELLGLAASMVLRCDDCISYHIIQARKAGASVEEVFETFSIALVVGGSIVIPHLRKAVDFLESTDKKS